MSNTCLQCARCSFWGIFKEEFNADITKVINCSTVCRLNPECTHREAHGAAEILPWLKHWGSLQACAFKSNSKNPFLDMGSSGSTGVSKMSMVWWPWLVFTTRRSCSTFQNTNFYFKDNYYTLAEYHKGSLLFPTIVTFHYLGLSQISEQIFWTLGGQREEKKPAVAEWCYLQWH